MYLPLFKLFLYYDVILLSQWEENTAESFYPIPNDSTFNFRG